MRLLTSLMVLVLLFGLVPISAAQGDEITVTQEQNDETITFQVGDTLRIELDANRTTNYDWLADFTNWTSTAAADVTVVEVLPDTPAAEADLRPGDVILTLNGQPVLSALDFNDQLAALDTDEATLTIMRDTQEGTYSLTLPNTTPPVIDRIYIDELAAGMPAAEAGFEIGDILLSIDGIDMTNVDQLIEYTSAHEGQEMQVSVLRAGETFVIPVTPQVDAEGVVRMGIAVYGIPVTPLEFVAINQNIAQHAGLRDNADSESTIIILELLGTPEYIAPADPAPGAGGTLVWTFQAMVPGTTNLTLHYLPIAEENPEPAETFHLTIVIEPDESMIDSGGETMTITDIDNGNPVSLQVGDTLRIELAANATTGYEWSLGLLDQTVVQQRGDPEYIAPADPIPGAGGTSVWTFEAVRAGTTPLILNYSRSFETGVEPVQVFEIAVTVE